MENLESIEKSKHQIMTRASYSSPFLDDAKRSQIIEWNQKHAYSSSSPKTTKEIEKKTEEEPSEEIWTQKIKKLENQLTQFQDQIEVLTQKIAELENEKIISQIHSSNLQEQYWQLEREKETFQLQSTNLQEQYHQLEAETNQLLQSKEQEIIFLGEQLEELEGMGNFSTLRSTMGVSEITDKISQKKKELEKAFTEIKKDRLRKEINLLEKLVKKESEITELKVKLKEKDDSYQKAKKKIQDKKANLEKAKSELMGRKKYAKKKMQEELENFLEAQEEVTRSNNAYVKKQLEKGRECLIKEIKFTKEELNSLCQKQEEITKLEINLQAIVLAEKKQINQIFNNINIQQGNAVIGNTFTNNQGPVLVGIGQIGDQANFSTNQTPITELTNQLQAHTLQPPKSNFPS